MIQLATEKYWALQWLDEVGLSTPQDVERFFRADNAIEGLAEFAACHQYIPAPLTGHVVVAGWGLGYGYSRSHSSELPSARVDDLLRRTWHYYDAVILEDAVRHELEWHSKDSLSERRRHLT